LQVHSLVGITISLILVVIATSGAMMSFEDEIQDMLNAGIMRVEPRSASMLAPDELIGRLRPAHDFGKVSAVMMTSDPSAAARISFARNRGGPHPTSVYVDPYDGHVLGVPRGEDFFATVRKLHRWLLWPASYRGGRARFRSDADLGACPAMATPSPQCQDVAEAELDVARSRLSLVASFGDRHMGDGDLSRHRDHRPVVFVRLV
jgi:PepSY-associated TM region